MSIKSLEALQLATERRMQDKERTLIRHAARADKLQVVAVFA